MEITRKLTASSYRQLVIYLVIGGNHKANYAFSNSGQERPGNNKGRDFGGKKQRKLSQLGVRQSLILKSQQRFNDFRRKLDNK